MPFGKSGLAAAVILTMASGGAALAADTPTPAQALATQIENDLKMQQAAAGATPLTDAQIQQAIATDLSLSTATLADKEAALMLVESASGLPSGAGADAGVALAGLEQTGTFVAGAGGGANGGAGFGATNAGGGLGGGSGGAPYKS